MLQYIKKYIKSWFLGLLFFFIFISFTFWGVGDIFRNPSNYVIKIGKTKISREIFLAEFQSNVNSHRKNNNDLSKNNLKKIANETLSNIANRYLIIEAATSMKLNISENVLRKNILQNTLFHNELKKDNFDENIFINFVNRNFGSEENYLNYLKNQILIEQISGYFENKITYPVNLSKKIYNQLEEKRSFDIASIDKIFEAKSIKIDPDISVEEFYEKNKKNYFFDERRSFTYIYIDLNELKKRITIEENEILELYELQKNDYLISEKRKVEQLFFNKKEDGLKTFKLIKKDDDFKKLADENKSSNFSYISLGLVEKSQLFTEFSESVFNLKKNEHTELIKSDIGWHILKVTEIKEGKVKKFEEVKDLIKQEIIENKSYDELDLLISETENELSNGISLEEIGNKLDLDVKQKKLVEKKIFLKENLNEFKNKSFFKDVFNKEIDSDLFIEEIEEGFFITRIDEILPSKQKNIEESYDDIYEDIKKETVKKKITNKINLFKKKLDENKEFFKISDSLDMNSRTTKKINREEMINQGFSQDIVEKAFKSKKDAIHEYESNDKYNILKVLTEIEVNFDDEKYNKINNDLNKIYGIDNFQQLIKILEKKYPIKINNNIVNDFINKLQY